MFQHNSKKSGAIKKSSSYLLKKKHFKSKSIRNKTFQNSKSQNFLVIKFVVLYKTKPSVSSNITFK